MVQAKAFIVPEKQAPFQSNTVELDVLQSGEVLVELKATGICQTDLVVQSGKIPVPFPAILGHEGTVQSPLVTFHAGRDNNIQAKAPV